tara:strand:+ start:2726 stop:3061 length:336 start_codon:yes stop_codon:yes gene_type:complete
MDVDDNSSDEDFVEEVYNTNINFETFYKNYDTMKKNYITLPKLNKYEKTKIISERAQQLSNGSISFLKNPETYSSVQEIALEELKQNKIPFIIERPIPNGVEYWKLEDCLF